MIRHIRIPALLLAAIAIALVASTPAQAGGFGCGSYIWSSPYPCDLTPLYSIGRLPLPPYFAMHPPVYYEMPVPRTYGYGPWAYPPQVMTPEIVEPTPEIIQNKFVPQSPKKAADTPKTASAPLIIRNPYVPQAVDEPEAALVAK